MENKGIIVGQLQNIKEEPNRNNAQKKDVVCDFIDTSGLQYSNIKMYGFTAEEIQKRGNSWAVLNYSLSVRTSASNQTTGKSAFAIFVRDVGFIHPNDVQSMPIMNHFDLVGTLAEDPIFTQEQGQTVVDVKLNVIRRTLNKQPDNRSGSTFDLLSFRLTKPTHIELISNCGKESTLVLSGKIGPTPGSYIVDTEITCMQVYFQKPVTTTQTNSMNQMSSQNSFNSGLLFYNPNTQVIMDQQGSTYDQSGNAYNYPSLQTKGAAGFHPQHQCTINNQVHHYIVNSQLQFINSEGQVVDGQGQLVQAQPPLDSTTTNLNAQAMTQSQGFATQGQVGYNPNGMSSQPTQDAMTQSQGFAPQGQVGYNPNGMSSQPTQDAMTQSQGFAPQGQVGYNPNGMSSQPTQDAMTQSQGFATQGQVGYNPNGMSSQPTQDAMTQSQGFAPQGQVGYNPNGMSSQPTQDAMTQSQGFAPQGQAGYNPNGMSSQPTQNAMTQSQGFAPQGQVGYNPNGMSSQPIQNAMTQSQGFAPQGAPFGSQS